MSNRVIIRYCQWSSAFNNLATVEPCKRPPLLNEKFPKNTPSFIGNLWRVLSLGNHLKYGVNSRKRPPKLDILGGRLREVRLYLIKNTYPMLTHKVVKAPSLARYFCEFMTWTISHKKCSI